MMPITTVSLLPSSECPRTLERMFLSMKPQTNAARTAEENRNRRMAKDRQGAEEKGQAAPGEISDQAGAEAGSKQSEPHEGTKQSEPHEGTKQAEPYEETKQAD